MASDSVLLKHEICYVLGQLQDVYAVPFLEQVLLNVKEHPIVRHEAAEALAAIGDVHCFDILKIVEADETAPSEVRDTCKLSLDMMQWRENHPDQIHSTYASVDPAPPFEASINVVDLGNLLVDQSKSLFERYRAMFSLRNIDSAEAVAQLARGFDDPNALFKHEIAFVFGQMGHPASLEALKLTLKKDGEHAMVRHEAAEAMGSVTANMSNGHDELLKEYVDDKNVDLIVRQSCEVALDIHDYWSSNEFDTAF